VLSLTASANVETPRDWLSISFATTREGTDAGAVQSQLKQALDAAVGEARRVAKGDGAVQVAAGGFSLQPRYSPKGQMNGWTGSTSLTVQGRDMSTIAQLVGRIGTLTVAGVSYGLSPEAREKAEGEATAQAIARYRARAATSAALFGYARYDLREVTVQSEMPQPRGGMMFKPMMAQAADSAALPVEAGEEHVVVTVSGTVQLAR
jgi:predicted secreted protein